MADESDEATHNGNTRTAEHIQLRVCVERCRQASRFVVCFVPCRQATKSLSPQTLRTSPATDTQTTTPTGSQTTTVRTSSPTDTQTTTPTGLENETGQMSPLPKATFDNPRQGAIAGGVVGGLVIILLIAGVGFILFRKRKRRQENHHPKSSVNGGMKLDETQTANDDNHYYSIDESRLSGSLPVPIGGLPTHAGNGHAQNLDGIPDLHHYDHVKNYNNDRPTADAEYNHLGNTVITGDQMYNKTANHSSTTQNNNQSNPVAPTNSTDGGPPSEDDKNPPYFVLESDANVQPRIAIESENTSEETSSNNTQYFVLESNNDATFEASLDEKNICDENIQPYFVLEKDKDVQANAMAEETNGYFILESDSGPQVKLPDSTSPDEPDSDEQRELNGSSRSHNYSHLVIAKENVSENYAKLSPDLTPINDSYFVLEKLTPAEQN